MAPSVEAEASVHQGVGARFIAVVHENRTERQRQAEQCIQGPDKFPQSEEQAQQHEANSADGRQPDYKCPGAEDRG